MVAGDNLEITGTGAFRNSAGDADDANVLWLNDIAGGTVDSKTVAITYASLAGVDAGNYNFTGQASTLAKITPKTVTVSGLTATDKIYNRDATATIDGSAAVFAGVINGETITVDTASGVFRNAMNTADDFNAGTNKLVAITSTSYTAGSGTSLDNYTIIDQATTNANITPRGITIAGITAADRDYDGTSQVTVDATGINWADIGVLAGDTISVVTSGTFADKNVAFNGGSVTSKTVTLTETYSGAALRNYSITKQGTAFATINQKAVTVSGLSAIDKVYDGNQTASINTSNVVISGLVFGDQVNVAASGTFAGKDVVAISGVAQNQTVTLLDFAYTGVDAANYSYTDQVSTTAKITPRALTLGAVAIDSREYDGTRTATISGIEYDGLVGNETLGYSATAQFADKNVGTNKLVSITNLALADGSGSGALAGLAVNYSLAQTSTTSSASITPKALTISGITASDKDYDGTVQATVDVSMFDATKWQALGMIAGDDLTITATGEFTDHRVARVGNDPTGTVTSKTVNLVEVFGGADARNYSITAQGSTTATITPIALSITGLVAQDKVYDRSRDAVIDVSNALFTTLIGTDLVTVSATGLFDSERVQFSNEQVVSQNVTIASTLGGADLGNYTVTVQDSDMASITRRALTVSGLSADTKVYNRNASATISQDNLLLNGLVDGDTVTVTATGIFRNATNTLDDWNVGSSKLVVIESQYSGGVNNDHLNYLITDQAFTTGAITPATLTISGITVEDKVYDGNIAATVDVSNANLSDLYAGDVVQVSANGFFADKNVNWDGSQALAKTVNLAETYTGADRRNYVITAQGSATATITQKALSISGTSVADKVYDRNDVATVTAGNLSLMFGNEKLGVTGVGTFADWNVVFDTNSNPAAQDVTVAYTLFNGSGGGLASNYSLAGEVLSDAAKITPKALTISGITAANRVYDGDVVAPVSVVNAQFNGLMSGDDVSVSASGVFANKNVSRDLNGTPIAKTVTLTETFAGDQSHNYSITAQGTTTATITPKDLTIENLTVANRQYDATTFAVVDVSGATRDGLVLNDEVIISATGEFANANVLRDANGNLLAQTVTISSSYSGVDWLNYTITDQTETEATIEPRVLTISALHPTLIDDKEYDQNDVAGFTVADEFPEDLFDNLIGTQTVELVETVATFASANVSRADPSDPLSAAIDKDVTVVYTIGDGFFGGFASNYTVANDVIQAKITPKAITISGITSDDRDYDQTDVAVINTSQMILNGLIDGDLVTVGVSGLFADKNVLRDADGAAIAKAVTLTEIFDGAQRSNYDITAQGTTTAVINPIDLQISGITAFDRVYDGTIAVVVDVTNANLAGTLQAGGMIAGDLVEVAATGSFVDQNVLRDADGTPSAKTVNLAEIVTGVDADNYNVMLQGLTTATVTPATLTAQAVRQYDGTAVVDGGIVNVTGVNGETFSATGLITMANKHVTTGAVTPDSVSDLSLIGDSGALTSNYNALSTADTDVTIDRRVVTITAPVITKTYDASAKHLPTSLELDAMSGQLVGADFVREADINFTGGASVVRDTDRSVPNTRTVTLDSVTIVDGNGGNNYDITLQGNSQSVIVPKALTVRPADDAKLLNTADVDGFAGLLFDGFVGVEGVEVFGANGENLPVISRAAGEVAEQFYALTATGGAANNYDLQYQTGQLEILPRDSLLLRVNIGADAITYGDAPTFANNLTVQYWGEGQTQPTTLTATGSNGQYTIAPGATGDFTANDSAQFVISVLNGVDSGAGQLAVGGYNIGVNADDLTLSGDAFKGLRLVGALTVDPKVIGAADLGITGLTKTYDGSTLINSLALDVSGGSMVLSGDEIIALGSGQFADRHVGQNLGVTLDVRLQGADASNYALSSTRLTTLDDGIVGGIEQLDTVQWVGASFGYWADASNWAGGAIPDRKPGSGVDNVANVVIADNVQVVFDLADVGAVGSAVRNDGQLQINLNADYDMTNVLSGSGELFYRGTDLLTISGNNTDFTGRLDMGSSAVELANDNALGSAITNIDIGQVPNAGLISGGGTLTVASGVTLSELIVQGRLTLGSDIKTEGSQIYYDDLVLSPSGSVATANTITLHTTDGHLSLLGKVDSGVDKLYSLHLITEDADKIITLGDSVGEGAGSEGYKRVHTLTLDAGRTLTGTVLGSPTYDYNGQIYLLADVLTANAQTYNGSVWIGNNGENGFLYDYFQERVLGPTGDLVGYKDYFSPDTTKASVDLDVALYLDDPLYARTLISENPTVVFNGSVNDLNLNTHTLLVAAIAPADPAVEPHIAFNGEVGGESSLYGVGAAAIRTQTDNTVAFAGGVTVADDVTAFADVVLFGGDSTDIAEQAQLRSLSPDFGRVVAYTPPNAAVGVEAGNSQQTQPLLLADGSVAGQGVNNVTRVAGAIYVPIDRNAPAVDNTPGGRPLPPGLVSDASLLALLNDRLNPNNLGVRAAINAANPRGLIQSIVGGTTLDSIRAGTLNLEDVQAALESRQESLRLIDAEVEVGILSSGEIDANAQASQDINCELPQYEDLLQCRPESGTNQ